MLIQTEFGMAWRSRPPHGKTTYTPSTAPVRDSTILCLVFIKLISPISSVCYRTHLVLHSRKLPNRGGYCCARSATKGMLGNFNVTLTDLSVGNELTKYSISLDSQRPYRMWRSSERRQRSRTGRNKALHSLLEKKTRQLVDEIMCW